ncbi:DUF835 domain-containing protein [Thermococcus sp.]
MVLSLRRRSPEEWSEDYPLVPYDRFAPFLRSKAAKKPIFLVTRFHPPYLEKLLGPLSSNVISVWLSNVSSPISVGPRELYRLESMALDNIRKRGTDVVLEGVEYLFLENGDVGALRFIGKLHDEAVIHGSGFYVVVSDAFSERQIAMLKGTLGLL